MIMVGVPWIPSAFLQPHRCHQLAWFLYGWIEREQVLNVTACTDWWMRAIGTSEAQFKASRRGLRITLPSVEPQVLTQESDQAESYRSRSSTHAGTTS